MNRSETRLLVENWRKVLNEGLYDNDPEILEENYKLTIPLALSLLFGGSALGKSTDNSTNNPTDQIIQTLNDSGASVSESDLYSFNAEGVKAAVNKCISMRAKDIQKKFKSDKKTQVWLSGVSSVFNFSEEELFSEVVMPSITSTAQKTCLTIFSQLYPSKIFKQSKGDTLSWDGKEAAEEHIDKKAKELGIDVKANLSSWKNEAGKFIFEIMSYSLKNLGNMGPKMYRTFIEDCRDRVSELRPDVEKDMDEITDGGNFFSNLFK